MSQTLAGSRNSPCRHSVSGASQVGDNVTVCIHMQHGAADAAGVCVTVQSASDNKIIMDL